MQAHTLPTSSSTPLAPRASAAARWSRFLLGVASYGLGVSGLVWIILATFGIVPFVGGLVRFESTPAAVLFNLGLVSLFGLQHAIMARPRFKERWTRIVPVSLERSLFVLATGLVTGLMMWGWNPLPTEIWSVSHPVLEPALYVLTGFGWTYLLASTFAINHFELFGLQQVWAQLHGREADSPAFVKRLMYRFDRHPIMTGALIGLWVTPHMNLDHLVLALGMTAYVIVGVSMEERDLVTKHGESYEAYRRSTGSLVPRLVKSS